METKCSFHLQPTGGIHLHSAVGKIKGLKDGDIEATKLTFQSILNSLSK